MTEKIILTNHDEHVQAFRDIDNKRKYAIMDNNNKNVLLRGREEHQALAIGGALIKTDTEEKLLGVLKRLNPTGQKAFLYIVNKAIKQNYTTDFFEVDINELLGILGLARKSDSINRLIEYLDNLKDISFYAKLEIFDRANKKRSDKPTMARTGYSSLLTDVDRVTKGRKTIAIRVRLGVWMEYLKETRELGYAQLLTLPIDCLRVDTKHFPYSFGVPYYMAVHARRNSRHNRDWEVLTLKEAIKGTEPWEETEKKIKLYGFNHKNGRSFIERFTQSLEHAETHFNFQWEWVGKEPETLQEAREAKIKFRFLEPLKNEKESAKA